MKRITLFAILILLQLPIVLAQEDPQIKKCVAFIFGKNARGEYSPRGTGFFVGTPTESDSTKAYVYLVTAKHVIQRKDKSFLTEIYLRMNTSTGGSDFVTLPLLVGRNRYFLVHEDPTVDIIVISVPPEVNKYDYLTLSKNMMSDKELVARENIREGDDVLFCGLFANYYGRQRNYPIFRFGKLALLTDERVPFEGQMAYLYLLESTAFGGNSGSPVFFKLSPNRNPSQLVVGLPNRYALAGVMRGFYGAFIDTAFGKTAVGDTILFQNAGIAAVSPSYQLLEIMNALPKRKE